MAAPIWYTELLEANAPIESCLGKDSTLSKRIPNPHSASIAINKGVLAIL